MSDQPQSNPPLPEAPDLETLRAGLTSNDPPAWNGALRTVLLEAVSGKLLWFDATGRVATAADRDGPRAALAELSISLLYSA